MSAVAAQQRERMAAMLLMAVITTGAFSVRSAALTAEMAVEAREHQVARLQSIRDRQASGGDLRALSSLFEGQELVWGSGAAGSYLTLRTVGGGNE